MTIFGSGGAWALGWRVVTSRFGAQAIMLVAIGIVLPIVLRLAIVGGTIADPAVPNARSGAAAFGGVVLMVSMLLQLTSYFGAWRLGLASISLGRAIGYGLLAGLVFLLVTGLAGALWGGALVLLGDVPGLAVIGGLTFAVPLLMIAAIGYTAYVAAMAVGFGIVLAVTMIAGTASGDVGMAATLFGGGSGFVVVLALIFCGLALWLAARLGCAGPIMGERGGMNFIRAARVSWELTADDQGRITAYLGLIGLGFAVAAFVFVLIIGVVALALGGGEGRLLASAIALLIAGPPAAAVSVAVPAGIYRALNQSIEAALVFA